MADLSSGCVSVKCSGSAGQTHAQVPAGARAALGCSCVGSGCLSQLPLPNGRGVMREFCFKKDFLE